MAIDTSCGLHQLGSVLRQLTVFEQHCRELTDGIDVLLTNTVRAAQTRTKKRHGAHPYRLFRQDVGDADAGSSFEIRLERALWKKYGFGEPSAPEWFLNHCCRAVMSYQVPTFMQQQQSGWGEVDLLGISANWLPVVLELKREDGDNPLRMIIEGVAYAVALRVAWNEGPLKDEWSSRLTQSTIQRAMPPTLESVPVVGIAPRRYWSRAVGGQPRHGAGQVPLHAWSTFRRLLHAVELRGFPVVFAQFDVAENGDCLPHVGAPEIITIPT